MITKASPEQLIQVNSVPHVEVGPLMLGASFLEYSLNSGTLPRIRGELEAIFELFPLILISI